MSIIETKIVMAGIFLTLFAAGFINPIQGETGKGTDVFSDYDNIRSRKVRR